MAGGFIKDLSHHTPTPTNTKKYFRKRSWKCGNTGSDKPKNGWRNLPEAQ
jgi:hypothetical protein